jgi:hypothetical protein
VKLHDLMSDELADFHAEPDRLIAHAAASRRHHRLTLAAVGLAVAAVVAGAGVVAIGHRGGHAVDPATRDTVPASPRAVAETLAHEIGLGALGDFGGAGQPTSWQGSDIPTVGYAAVAGWESRDGADIGAMTLAVTRQSGLGTLLGDGEPSSAPSVDSAQLCSSPEITRPCDTTTLADGDVLVTFGDASNPSALLSSPHRNLIVLASAQVDPSSTSPWRTPARAQLTALVEQPWWGWDLPVEYAGADIPLAEYTEQTLDPNAPPPSGDVASATASSSAAAPRSH